MKFHELNQGDRFRFRLATPSVVYRVVLKRDDSIHYSWDTGPLYIVLNTYGIAWNAEVERIG